MFGLLSFQALPRRLKLDFSDIFDKGFGFDRIEGDFVISEGDAFTNDLSLKGTSATLQMSGRTGLAGPLPSGSNLTFRTPWCLPHWYIVNASLTLRQ